MKKQIQTRSLLGVLIVLIIFAVLTVVIPRYYSLRDIQNQILNADENEIELSSNVLVSENKLGIFSVINPFDNSINDLKAEINRDLSPIYDKHVKILDKLIERKIISTNVYPTHGYLWTSNLPTKVLNKVEKAKELNQSNRVESVRLLKQSLRYMDTALDTRYHHATGNRSAHYDVILEDFGIEGKTETLLGYIETMYEYDRAEEHATAYYYFILYNEEGNRLLDEYVKPIVETKQEEARSKYDEAKKVSEETTYVEENEDDIYFRFEDKINRIRATLQRGDSEFEKEKYEKAYETFEEVIKDAEEYIENYS